MKSRPRLLSSARVSRRQATRGLLPALAVLVAWVMPVTAADRTSDGAGDVGRLAGNWRAGRRIVDLHQHIDYTAEHLGRAVRIMDRAGIGLEVNLSGGTTTHEPGKPSEIGRASCR